MAVTKSSSSETQNDLGAHINACLENANGQSISDAYAEYTYGQFNALVRHFIDELSKTSVGKGLAPEPALLIHSNRVCDLALFYALAFLNCTPFIGDPVWDRVMIEKIVSKYGIKAAVSISSKDDGKMLSHLHLEEFQGDHDSSYIEFSRDRFVRFSSGSSGVPKALLFSNAAAIRAANTWRSVAAINSNDRILCVATINNGLAFNTSLLPAFQAGAALRLYNGRLTPSAICKVAERFAPTIVVGFPFVWSLLLKGKVDLIDAFSSVRSFVSSSSAVSPEERMSWQERTGQPLRQYYGIAEAGPVSYWRDGDGLSDGTLLPGCEVEIVTPIEGVGRLRVRTPYMAEAYVGEYQSLIDKDGYYTTSDSAKLADGTQLTLQGRIDDVINIAGKKISLRSIEQKLLRIDNVRDCAAFRSSDGSNDKVELNIVRAKACQGGGLDHQILRETGISASISRITYVNEIRRSSTGKALGINN